MRQTVGLSETQISNAYYKAGELTRILHKKFSGDYFGRPDCNGKMYERYFPDFPKGEKAFFKGYGLEVLEEKSQQIKIACIKAGLCNVVWGEFLMMKELYL